MTSRDLLRCCEAVRSAILATIWILVSGGFSGRRRSSEANANLSETHVDMTASAHL